MVRSGLPANRPQPKVRPAATILFAGPLGAGVGIAADVLADVARLSHRTVVRRRDFSTLERPLNEQATTPAAKVSVLQLVSFGDATHAADATQVDLAIAWDHASAAALRAAGIEAREWIVVDPTSQASVVPSWRRDLIAAAATAAGETNDGRVRSSGLHRTARALKALSSRLPFTRELWQRVLKLHVPARRRRAVAAGFSA